MNLSKLNRILAFCEAEIKNEFREPFNPLSTLLFRFGWFLSKTFVFEGRFRWCEILETPMSAI